MSTNEAAAEQRLEVTEPESNATVSASPEAMGAANSSDAATDPAWAVEAKATPTHPEIQALTAAILRLSQQVAADQNIISRMQRRIEMLQGDQVRALLAPAVTELANLHAEFAESAGRDYERLGVERARQEFSFLGEQVESALDLLGAVSLNAKVGDVFDSKVHQAIKKVPTSDASLDRTVAAVVRQGFTFDTAGKPALYARVRVLSYEPRREVPALPPEPSLEPIAQSIPVIPSRPTDHIKSSQESYSTDELELPFS